MAVRRHLKLIQAFDMIILDPFVQHFSFL